MSVCVLLVASMPFAQMPVLDLRCELSPGTSSMRVVASVTLVATDKPTDTATFFLSDRMQPPRVRIAEPTEMAGEVVATAKSTRDHDVTYEVKLPQPLVADKRLKLSFEYASKDPKGFVYMLAPQICFAGGYNTCWFPSVGSSRRMLGALEFKSPAGFIVKASGRELGATESGGVRTSRFAIEQPIVPTFSAARYKVTKVPGAVPMTLYLLKDRPIADAYAKGCSRILEVLTREFGKYAFPDFSIIETPSPESSRDLGFSGASFEGFMFADSDSIDSGFNLAYFGHEIGHQWWGNLVQLSGDKGAYMLSEALAQFGSLRCVDEIEGAAMSARYRFTGYPGYSSRQNARGAIMYGPTDVDRPLSSLPSGSDTVYHQLANAKGFLAWDSIARQIGRDRFRKALRAVTAKYAWGSVTYEAFLDEVRKAAGRNVDGILSQWLGRTGAPVLWPEWTQTGGVLSLTVNQTAPPYTLSLPVQIQYADGSAAIVETTLSTESTNLQIKASKPVVSVVIDPNWEVFHSTPQLQAEALALRDHTLGIFATMRRNEKDAEAAFQLGLTRIPAPDPYAAEFALRVGLANVYRRTNRPQEAKAEFLRALSLPTRTAADLPWAYFRLAQILRAEGDEAGAVAAAHNADSADLAVRRATGVATQVEAFLKSMPK
jgi:hypothetical protein